MLMAFLAKPFVKWIALAILASILLAFAVNKWNNFKEGLIEEGRVMGFQECQDAVNKKIAENNRVNRAVEQKVGEELEGFAKELDEMRQQRMGSETRIERTIERQVAGNPTVFNNPDCVVPSDVIDGRNDIRALGPKAEAQ